MQISLGNALPKMNMLSKTLARHKLRSVPHRERAALKLEGMRKRRSTPKQRDIMENYTLLPQAHMQTGGTV